MASSPSYSTTVNCERTNYGSDAYSSPEAFESWWPKNLGLDGDKFKEAGSGSKAMVYENTGGENNTGIRFKRTLRLLPNNLLIGAVKPFGNYAPVSNVRYKCDINSNELRAKLAEGGTAHSTSSGTVVKSAGEKLSKAEKMFDGHSESALCHTATWVDGNRLNFWDITDFSGPYPQGTYASLLA